MMGIVLSLLETDEATNKREQQQQQLHLHVHHQQQVAVSSSSGKSGGILTTSSSSSSCSQLSDSSATLIPTTCRAPLPLVIRAGHMTSGPGARGGTTTIGNQQQQEQVQQQAAGAAESGASVGAAVLSRRACNSHAHSNPLDNDESASVQVLVHHPTSQQQQQQQQSQRQQRRGKLSQQQKRQQQLQLQLQLQQQQQQHEQKNKDSSATETIATPQKTKTKTIPIVSTQKKQQQSRAAIVRQANQTSCLNPLEETRRLEISTQSSHVKHADLIAGLDPPHLLSSKPPPQSPQISAASMAILAKNNKPSRHNHQHYQQQANSSNSGGLRQRSNRNKQQSAPQASFFPDHQQQVVGRQHGAAVHRQDSANSGFNNYNNFSNNTSQNTGGVANNGSRRRASNGNNNNVQIPTNNLRDGDIINGGNRKRNNHHQYHHQRRDHRSLSTSSSLASSASSSPSSSMIQICSHKDILRHNSNNNHRRQSSPPQNSHRKHHHHQHHNHQLIVAHTAESSASSTISSSSSVDSAHLSPRQKVDSGGELLHSTANSMSLERATLNQPYPIINTNSNHQQPAATFHHHQPTSAFWIYASQQQQTNTAHHHLSYPNLLGLYPTPPPRPWLLQQVSAAAATGSSNQESRCNSGYRTQQQEECCTFTSTQRPTDKQQQQQQPQPEFTVISYNVLCDRMVNNEMFPSSPDIALNWLYRRELIMRQLLEFDADIIALQELEMEQFETYFSPELNQFGHYASLFEPKSRAKTMDNIHKRQRVDGCAIFFKMNKFKLVQRHLLEFSQIAMANAQGSEAMLNRVMTKDNIGLAAILEFIGHESSQQQQYPMKQTTSTSPVFGIADVVVPDRVPQRILVCNTHIHWDPECCDVKLIQTIMLMNELESIARHHSQQQCQQQVVAKTSLDPPPCDIEMLCNRFSTSTTGVQHNSSGGDNNLLPLILLGDFNSLPNSGVTTYLTAGKISSLHKDFKNFKYTSCSNALSTSTSDASSYYNNNNNNINNLRRQSSPAWCFYSPSSSPTTSTDSALSSSTGGQLSPVNLPTQVDLDEDDESEVLNYNHPFRLVSAYEKDTMPYTNYTTKFKAIIDYIFYSPNSIQLLGLLGPLDKNWLKGNKIKGLPQPHLPSDHLPLLVKFKLTGEIPTTTSPQMRTILPRYTNASTPHQNIDYSRASSQRQGTSQQKHLSVRMMNSHEIITTPTIKHEQNRS